VSARISCPPRQASKPGNGIPVKGAVFDKVYSARLFADWTCTLLAFNSPSPMTSWET
jgi:hypothetical protein